MTTDNKTIAQQAADMPYADAIEFAESNCWEVNQDWDNEATFYAFADGSCLRDENSFITFIED